MSVYTKKSYRDVCDKKGEIDVWTPANVMKTSAKQARVGKHMWRHWPRPWHMGPSSIFICLVDLYVLLIIMFRTVCVCIHKRVLQLFWYVHCNISFAERCQSVLPGGVAMSLQKRFYFSSYCCSNLDSPAWSGTLECPRAPTPPSPLPFHPAPSLTTKMNLKGSIGQRKWSENTGQKTIENQ